MSKPQLLLRTLSGWGQPNLRNWSPEDPETIAEWISADIGHRTRQGNDTFSIKVATPAGLKLLEANEGIIAMRPLLVIDRYDFGSLWRWFEATVARCDGPDWSACVEKLRLYFNWEYDDYVER